jgi:DNA-binding TFAR19-related protein (PDSD5 family)
MSEDAELERIKARRMEKMQRQLRAQQKKQVDEKKTPPSPREALRSILVGRAWEVLDAAERQYPAPARALETELARLVRANQLSGPVTAEQLLWLFRRLGMDVRLDTKIQILESGELKSLADKLKGQ